MINITRHLTLAAAIIAITGLSAPAGAALVQYSYTGNPFTVTDINQGPSVGDIRDLVVRIGFIVDESLLPRNGHVILDARDYSSALVPFKFSFSLVSASLGQIYTINSASFYTPPDNSGIDPHFHTYADRDARIEFDTDANGHLSGNWDAKINDRLYGRPGLLAGTSIRSSNFVDSVEFSSGEVTALIYRNGSITNNPGTWTRITPVPEPGSWILFSIGLGVLLVKARQVRTEQRVRYFLVRSRHIGNSFVRGHGHR